MKPRVTIVIPTLNRETLAASLNSVNAQTFRSFEIIIVDDSRDQSVKLSSFQIIKTGGLTGVSKARNLGMFHAKTEFIALLDDDDVWNHEYLEKQILNFDRLGIDFGLTGALVNGNRRPKKSLQIGTDPYELLYGTAHLLRSEAYLPTSSYMFRTEIVRNAGFDDSISDRENLKFVWECFKRGYKVYQDPQSLVSINYSSKNSLSRIDFAQEIQWFEYLKKLNCDWSQNFVLESARNFIRIGDRKSARILVGMLDPQTKSFYKALLKLASL